MKSSTNGGKECGTSTCLSPSFLLLGQAVCLRRCSQPLGWCKPAGCQLTSKESWWFARAEGLLLLKVGFQHHREMFKSPPFPSLCSRKQVPYFIHWLVWLWQESCPYFGYLDVC